MIRILKLSRSALLGLALFAASTVTASAAIIQLGFALDSSGSVSSSNYALQTAGLAAALAGIPTDSTVEVTVIDFGSSVTSHVTTVLVDSVATRDAIVNTVSSMAKGGGSTSMAAAITDLTAKLTGSANFAGNDSIINISTDGAPNSSIATTTAALAALAAGIDALTSEAIGAGANTNFLASIVFNPQGGLGTGVVLPTDSNPPNPLTSAAAWVVPVSDFDAYAEVIGSKVSIITDDTTDIPVPGTLLLLGLGLLGLRVSRRAQA